MEEGLKKSREGCCVCFEWINHPRILPCLHKICTLCLNEVLSDAAAKGKTPACLACGESFDDKARIMVDVTEAQALTTGAVCANCHVFSKAAHYCCPCNKSLCDYCASQHRISAHSNPDNNAASSSSFSSSASSAPATTTSTFAIAIAASSLPHRLEEDFPKCDYHINQPQKLVCFTCSILICEECSVSFHAGHESQEYLKALGIYRSKLNSTATILRTKLPVIDAALHQLDSTQALLQTQTMDTLQTVECDFNGLIATLQHRRDTLVAMVRERFCCNVKMLDLEREELLVAKDAISTACKQAENLLVVDPCPDSLKPVLELNALTCARLESLHTKKPNPNSALPGPLYYSSVSPDLLSRFANRLGTLDNGRDLTQINVPSKVIGSRGRNPGEFMAPTEITTDLTGNLIVVDSSNSRLQILSPEGDALRILPLGNCTPLDASLHRDGHIWIVERQTHRVTLYSTHGEILVQIDYPKAQSVKVLPNGNIVVCGGQFVSSFSETGALLWRFVAEQEGFRGIGLSAIGEVFVTNYALGFITVLSADNGCHLYDIGNAQGLFQGPVSVAALLNGCLVVTEGPQKASDEGPHRVSIVTKHGERKHIWGGPKGKEPGQFNRPWGVIILPTGVVVVVDHGNNRLQFF